MGKQKEEAEEPRAVDSDYSGRPIDGITIEELRADHARGGIIYDDSLSLAPLQDGEPPGLEDGDRT